MGRRVRLVFTALAGAILLALALAITPPAPAVQHTRLVISRTVTGRVYAGISRARIVTASMPQFYAARPGDSLWSVAARFYGDGRRWPALWWVNRHAITNPAALAAGTTLRLSAWHPRSAGLYRKAVAAIPVPRPDPARGGAPALPTAAPPLTPAVAPVSAGAPGGFQACVIQAESGGNPTAVNSSSGAGGLYGFLPSTWAALGHSGLPENASVAEQNQAFAQEYAQAGTAPWAPYDGC